MDGVDLCCRAGLERGAHNLLKAKIDLFVDEARSPRCSGTGVQMVNAHSIVW